MSNETMNSLILGAVSMASLVAALFFLKFWRQTQDHLFVFFSLAFAVDAVTRVVLGLSQVSNEDEPIFYLGRLVTFALILVAIVRKNRARPAEPRPDSNRKAD
jgi:hypothetical protein